MNDTDVLIALATTQFRPFTDSDWDAFSGCETADPMIGEKDDFVIIVDGDKVCVVNNEGEETLFFLSEFRA